MRIASGNADHVIQLWDPDIDQSLISLRGHTDAVLSVTFSPDGRLIASSDRKGQVKLWTAMAGVDSSYAGIPTLHLESSR
jgi:WD40 repeat protein